MITSNPAGRAGVVQDACGTLRIAGEADSPAVEYQKVREQCPLLTREKRHQCFLDLDRVCLVGKAEPNGQSPDMSVDDDAFIHTKRITEQYVRRLAPYAGQLDKIFHGRRNDTAVSRGYSSGHSEKASGLASKKTRAANKVFHDRRLGSRQRGSIGERLEQGGCHQVHPLVGALSAEYRRHEQLKRRLEIKLAMGVRIFLPEACKRVERVSLERRAAFFPWSTRNLSRGLGVLH